MCDEEAMMTRTAACREVETMLREQMPILNRRQRRALARWVTGAILADSANKPSVVQALTLLGEAATSSLDDAWEQWLHQHAQQETDPPETGSLDVPSPLACGAALLQWVMRMWTGGPLVLGIDASLRRDAVVLLRISVLYRGTAIPVSWVIVPANQKGAWMPHLQRMLRWLNGCVAADQTVIVFADQGLWSPQLWEAIRANGWHPALRGRRDMFFAPDGQQRQRVVGTIVRAPGEVWIGAGVAFKHKRRRIAATLAAVWEYGQAEPWLILTDLPADQMDPAWYALRMWDEHGFRDSKSMGFGWQRGQLRDCDAAAWQYLVVAVATLWVVAVGTRIEDAQAQRQAPGRMQQPPTSSPAVNQPRQSGTAHRVLSLVRQGRQWARWLLARGRRWLRLWLRPEPLPATRTQMAIQRHCPS
jgi:hypothetical protein